MDKVLFSSNNMSWETPTYFFDKLNKKFKFDLDACASDGNHKLNNYYTEKDDALTKNWGGKRIHEPTLRQTHRRICQKGL